MKHFSNIAFLKALLLIAVATLGTGCSRVNIETRSELPASAFNPQNELRKIDILDLLDSASTQNKLIVGQNIDHVDNGIAYELVDDLNRKPALLGFDLGYDELYINDPALLAYIKEHANAGGLVTISTHMPNPFNRKGVQNKKKVALEKLVSEEGDPAQNFKQILVNIGNYLQVLKDEEMVVLFRPFHEMNGGWFWWGNDKTWPIQSAFRALWQYVHNYFSIERQLDNLLWVYSPNYQYSSSQKSSNYYYPGDDFVDIVALDFYEDDLSLLNQNNSLDLLKSYQKPIGIAEIGPGETRDGSFDNLSYLDLQDYGGISYFMTWHSYPKNAMSLRDNSNSEPLLDSEEIWTLDEL